MRHGVCRESSFEPLYLVCGVCKQSGRLSNGTCTWNTGKSHECDLQRIPHSFEFSRYDRDSLARGLRLKCARHTTVLQDPIRMKVGIYPALR
jgi:hypothetical protein